MADLKDLVEKVMTDDEFVTALVNNPEKTLKEAGVEPTEEILDAIKGLDVEAVRKLASSFGDENAAL